MECESWFDCSKPISRDSRLMQICDAVVQSYTDLYFLCVMVTDRISSWLWYYLCEDEVLLISQLQEYATHFYSIVHIISVIEKGLVWASTITDSITILIAENTSDLIKCGIFSIVKEVGH